jgi:hypothetical protein
MNKPLFALLIVFVVILSACESLPFFNDGKEKIVSPDEIRQFADKAEATSSYGGKLGGNRDDQSPYAATGQFDVKECGDSQMAWVPAREDDGLQSITLSYPEEVFASKIKVIESFNPGYVVKVELSDLSDNGEFKTVWEGKDKTKKCPGTLDIAISEKEGNITRPMVSYKTSKVRVTIDTDVPDWNEVDSVELIGYNQKWYIYNQTLFIEEEKT